MHYGDFKQQNLEPNAYTLFLILILLVLSTNNDFDERLRHISDVIKSGHNTIRMMRSSMRDLQTTISRPQQQ